MTVERIKRPTIRTILRTALASILFLSLRTMARRTSNWESKIEDEGAPAQRVEELDSKTRESMETSRPLIRPRRR